MLRGSTAYQRQTTMKTLDVVLVPWRPLRQGGRVPGPVLQRWKRAGPCASKVEECRALCFKGGRVPGSVLQRWKSAGPCASKVEECRALCFKGGRVPGPVLQRAHPMLRDPPARMEECRALCVKGGRVPCPVLQRAHPMPLAVPVPRFVMEPGDG